jgi:hypothetical protein
VSSKHDANRLLDLDRDLPVTPEDVKALRQAARDVPSWLTLEPHELEALLPADALDRRPLAQDHWTPFTME